LFHVQERRGFHAGRAPVLSCTSFPLINCNNLIGSFTGARFFSKKAPVGVVSLRATNKFPFCCSPVTQVTRIGDAFSLAFMFHWRLKDAGDESLQESCKKRGRGALKWYSDPMAPDKTNSIQTRSSLLNRLKAEDDAESWQEFYRIYGKLVRDFGIQAGLTDSEADEVVQETAISLDLAEVKGQENVKRAMEIAAAGGHNLLMLL
jgi:hypothetical protein